MGLSTLHHAAATERTTDLPEAIRQGHAGTLDLRHAALSGADLDGCELSGFDLSGADLSGANLNGARMFKTTLHGANLSGAHLRAAELTGADLSHANLENSDFSGGGIGMADLRKSKLFNADLSSTTLSGADLEGADLRCCRLEKARLRESRLVDADLTGADLRGADLSLSTVAGALFVNVDLRDSRLRMIRHFDKASWIGADIRDINFAGAYLMHRFIVDQNYLKEFKESNRLSAFIYRVWWFTSDCGRSVTRWSICILLLILFYSGVYELVEIDYGDHPTWFSSIYFSIVTITTLGYGDVLPASLGGQIVVISEVISGYLMLGGLLSIFSNKMARRAE